MINAAIVGLGWWGKTLVKSAENSDAIRFVCGTTRTMTPELEAFAKKRRISGWPKITRRCSPIPASMPWCSPRRIPCTARRWLRLPPPGKHVFCEKPFTLTKQQAEDAVAAVRKAGRHACARL